MAPFVFVAIDDDGKPRAVAQNMKCFIAVLSVLAMLAPAVAWAHPHIWISQHGCA